MSQPLSKLFSILAFKGEIFKLYLMLYKTYKDSYVPSVENLMEYITLGQTSRDSSDTGSVKSKLRHSETILVESLSTKFAKKIVYMHPTAVFQRIYALNLLRERTPKKST